MAITQAIATSFKTEILTGTHALTTDTIKIAMFTSAANLNASTTSYSATSEVSGTNYVAGGTTITATVTSIGTTAIVDFTDAAWNASTIANASGALIYNSSKSNKAIAVLDFQSPRSSTASNFVISFPNPDASNAIIRIT